MSERIILVVGTRATRPALAEALTAKGFDSERALSVAACLQTRQYDVSGAEFAALIENKPNTKTVEEIIAEFKSCYPEANKVLQQATRTLHRKYKPGRPINDTRKARLKAYRRWRRAILMRSAISDTLQESKRPINDSSAPTGPLWVQADYAKAPEQVAALLSSSKDRKAVKLALAYGGENLALNLLKVNVRSTKGDQLRAKRKAVGCLFRYFRPAIRRNYHRSNRHWRQFQKWQHKAEVLFSIYRSNI